MLGAKLGHAALPPGWLAELPFRAWLEAWARQALRAGRHFYIIFDVRSPVRVLSPQTFAPRQREQISNGAL